MKETEIITITPIAHIETDFKDKFGIPRQSGIVPGLTGRIVFEPEFRNPEALKGIEGYDRLWLVWGFSEHFGRPFHATVKPPRLKGKEKKGVFASRAPYRPNPLGLSNVRLIKVEADEKLGTVLIVEGADMLDGTPIYDIKPYLPYADAWPDARGGFADKHVDDWIEVHFPEGLLERLPEEKRETVIAILKQDPRAVYESAPDSEYRMRFADFDIVFTVSYNNVLTVTDVIRV